MQVKETLHCSGDLVLSWLDSPNKPERFDFNFDEYLWRLRWSHGKGNDCEPLMILKSIGIQEFRVPKSRVHLNRGRQHAHLQATLVTPVFQQIPVKTRRYGLKSDRMSNSKVDFVVLHNVILSQTSTITN